MAVSIVKVSDPDIADSACGVYDITGDASYPANGYPLPPASFGRKALHSVIPIQKGAATRIITYDPTQGPPATLRIWTALSTEAATSSDQSSVSCRVRVTGPLA